MSEITFQLTKTLTPSGKGGTVSIYVSMHRGVGVYEAQRFALALKDAIALATRWQEGNEFAVVKEDQSEPVERAANVKVL